MKVRWLKRALRAVETAADVIGKDNPAAAERFIRRVFDEVATLQAHPHRGRPGRVPGTRELVVPSTAYILAYRVIEDELQVLHVLHGRRVWPRDFR